ncbi:winged helix-turn-helix domain-containing protein [Enterococcus sp. BWR-S5]|uniref:winged helix-turn-helix domain-containing protein n=1 Tax=Enterococcus sp. BWR-S5 TaxID=2787714 RepID=UPI0019219E67|nr:helix-turn-helix domain-containing protein [Enterococcus sp. BWR-S5]MBL1227328.1 winged helix-turn-helix domain-containing protein [Enterococcus sp. BWR-S5]
MFHLNCISVVADSLLESYTDRFVQSNYCINTSSSYQIAEKAETFDGILIFEEDLNNIGEVCKYIIDVKKESKAFIWIIVPEQIHSAKLIYLQMGVDAVFTRESEIEENILTMSNALKRYKEFSKQRNVDRPVLDENRPLKLNSMNLSAVIDGTLEIPLTRIEYKIMELLLKNPNIAISYQDIYKEIWTDESEHSKFRVSNVIFHLRKKLEEDSLEPRFIKTIRSKGYLINV